MSKTILQSGSDNYLDSAAFEGINARHSSFTAAEGRPRVRLLSMTLFVTLLFAVICLGTAQANAGFNVKRIESRLAYTGHTHLKWVSVRYPYVVDACLRGTRFRMIFNKKRRMKGRTKLGHCRHDRLKYYTNQSEARELVPSLKEDYIPNKDFSGKYAQREYVSKDVYNDESHDNYRIESFPEDKGSSGLNTRRPINEYNEALEYQLDRKQRYSAKRFPRYEVLPLPLILQTLEEQGFYKLRVRRKFLGLHSIRACYGKRRYHLRVNGWGEIIREKYRGRCYGYKKYSNTFHLQY